MIRFSYSDADPPSLEIQPSTGLVLAQKGDAVVLTCVADEDPTRRITWEKKVSPFFELVFHLIWRKEEVSFWVLANSLPGS